MGLRDDIAAMELHQRNGTLSDWWKGTAPVLPRDPDQPDHPPTMIPSRIGTKD